MVEDKRTHEDTFWLVTFDTRNAVHRNAQRIISKYIYHDQDRANAAFEEILHSSPFDGILKLFEVAIWSQPVEAPYIFCSREIAITLKRNRPETDTIRPGQ